MRKFTQVSSVAAPIDRSDVDTDLIFPARFLLLLNRAGLGKHLFNDLRTKSAGEDVFVLDQSVYQNCEIIVAGERFGIGSSREHAVWALSDAGIRCVIARSFGDIFRANCFKNGVLPIELGEADHARVMSTAFNAQSISIDLETCSIALPSGDAIAFAIPDQQRRSLLLGLDEIGAILEDDADAIADFEARQKQAEPWLYLSEDQLSSFDHYPPAEPHKDATP